MREGAARASSIAEAAGVSRSTVTSTLKALKSMGYVDYEPYSLVHLTEAGMHIGRDIAHRHIVIQEFFQHILQLEPNVSNDVACELEHVIPPDVIRRLGQFVLYLRSRGDWKRQEDYRNPAEHEPVNTDKDLSATLPMLAMRTQMMGTNCGKYR
ncbi:MAG: metal-dependent transcriptional regulator [Bilophila wadsworthia]